MTMDNVTVKPETRNHKGFFVQEASYKLMGIEDSGWALICVENSCHYVDPVEVKKTSHSTQNSKLGRLS